MKRELDPVIQFLNQAATREPAVTRVLLFGSRARGDQHSKSDYDVAIEAPDWSDADWARFSLDLREKVPTLCGLDLVRLRSETPIALANVIHQEGTEIYVRKPR